MTEEFKIIDWRLYDPSKSIFGKKNDKASFTTVKCSNSKNCTALKEGKCVIWHGLGITSCPYGKVSKEYGYTVRAKKFLEWINQKKEIVKNIPQLNELKTICVIGDYVFIPYPHWTLCSNITGVKKSSIFSSGEKFVSLQRFTTEFFQKLVVGKPQAIFGGEITSYQKKVVPKMVLHLEENIPLFFKQWKKDFPETAKKFEIKDYVGRKALVKTLKKGCLIKHRKGLMTWDGEKIIFEDYNDPFMPISGKKTTLFIYPKENTSVEITDNSQVTPETKFID